MTARPDWDEWALGIAKAVARRGDCTRRRVGCVILSADDHDVIGVGYNGTEAGGPSCLDGDCPRGRHYPTEKRDLGGGPGSVVIYECDYHPDSPGGLCASCTPLMVCAADGEPWPCLDAVPPGSSYDTGPGTCLASHAEQNAVARVGQPWRLPGSTLYVTEDPCEGCIKQIRNTTQIAAICWPDGYTAFPRR